jgi:ABC-type protease/lipase transport system fused ATPase/permease subunit
VGGGTTQTSLGSHMSSNTLDFFFYSTFVIFFCFFSFLVAKFLAISTLLGGVVVFSMMMKTKESEEYDPLLESI